VQERIKGERAYQRPDRKNPAQRVQRIRTYSKKYTTRHLTLYHLVQHLKPTASYPKRGPAKMHTAPYFQSRKEVRKKTPQFNINERKRTCNNGCPATILKKRSSPSLLLSITSSEKRLVKTFPGRVGMFTLVDSCSRISRKASKSE
jgi:hypothetical protein